MKVASSSSSQQQEDTFSCTSSYNVNVNANVNVNIYKLTDECSIIFDAPISLRQLLFANGNGPTKHKSSNNSDNKHKDDDDTIGVATPPKTTKTPLVSYYAAEAVSPGPKRRPHGKNYTQNKNSNNPPSQLYLQKEFLQQQEHQRPQPSTTRPALTASPRITTMSTTIDTATEPSPALRNTLGKHRSSHSRFHKACPIYTSHDRRCAIPEEDEN